VERIVRHGQERDVQAYRFVVVYRAEPRPRGGDRIWRGWIEQVFPETDTENARHFFDDPTEIGAYIETAVKDVSD
jgi:hypothetical protein